MSSNEDVLGSSKLEFSSEMMEESHLKYVLYGCLTFSLVNLISKNLLVPSSASKNKKQIWKWANIFTSFLHSALTGFGSILIFYMEPELGEDIIHTYSYRAHIILSISIGYFIYDFVDMWMHNPKKSTYELLVHHVTVVACFGITIHTKKYLAFGLLGMMVEVNSVFLHARQLYIIQGKSKQTVEYRNVSLLNVATFILFRVVLLGWMTRWVAINREVIAWPFFFLSTFGLTVIMGMNATLFYRILKTDFFQCSISNDEHEKNFHPVSKDVNRFVKDFFSEDSVSHNNTEINSSAAAASIAKKVQ